MFLKAKVLEVRDNFGMSIISSAIIATNDPISFKNWMNKNYMFITTTNPQRMVREMGGLEYSVKILYQKRNQHYVEKIIKKWGMYDPNQKTFLEKIDEWLTFYFGSFIDV